jgi:hypothetical protein
MGGRNLKRLLMPSLSAAWCPFPSRGSWQKLGGFEAGGSDWVAMGKRKRKKGEQPRRIHRPGGPDFDLLPSMSLEFWPFQNRLPSKPGRGPPLGLVLLSELLQSFSWPCCHATAWVLTEGP